MTGIRVSVHDILAFFSVALKFFNIKLGCGAGEETKDKNTPELPSGPFEAKAQEVKKESTHRF